MSYDITFFPLAPGQGPEEGYEALGEIDDEEQPAAGAAVDRGRIADLVSEADPPEERTEDDDCIELSWPDSQLSICEGEIAISVPYWDSVDGSELAARIMRIGQIVQEATGYTAWDPQLGQALDFPGDAALVAQAFAAGEKTTRRIGRRWPFGRG